MTQRAGGGRERQADRETQRDTQRQRQRRTQRQADTHEQINREREGVGGGGNRDRDRQTEIETETDREIGRHTTNRKTRHQSIKKISIAVSWTRVYCSRYQIVYKNALEPHTADKSQRWRQPENWKFLLRYTLYTKTPFTAVLTASPLLRVLGKRWSRNFQVMHWNGWRKRKMPLRWFDRSTFLVTSDLDSVS